MQILDKIIAIIEITSFSDKLLDRYIIYSYISDNSTIGDLDLVTIVKAISIASIEASNSEPELKSKSLKEEDYLVR